jgi:acyl carrier protein
VADSQEIEFDATFDRVVASSLEVDQVPHGDVDLLKAGLNSLGFVTLMITLEEELSGSWPVEMLRNYSDLTTVARLRLLAKTTLWRHAE